MTNQNKIECLASFIVTGIYDETFLYVGYELQTFKMEFLQYRLVPDYLTTKRPGYLETKFYIHCYNYITIDNAIRMP